MTRAEFVERHRHEIAGFLLDAVTQDRKGGELAMWLRLKMRAIDTRLSIMWDELAKNFETDPAEDGERFPRAAG